MRIISGIARGMRLEAPEGRDVRPTEDRVKESIFSTLGDLSGAVVLDLFAGTGALGLEAASRGAAQVYGVESERAHCGVIRKNLLAFERVARTEGIYRLVEGNVRDFLKLVQLRAGSVDVILADPPYETAPGAYGWRELMADSSLADLLKPDGLLMLEHGSDKELPWYPETRWKCVRSKVFGIRAVSYCALRGETL